MTDVPPTNPQTSGVTAGDEIPDLLTVPEGALYSARLPMAMAYAAVLHSPQTRKDDRGTPYITHPLTVAGNVWHYGLGVPIYESEMEDLVIAAVLHDIVEDTGGDNRLREIQSMFGSRVAQIVHDATDSTVEDPSAKPPWRDRKEQHIARVRRLAAPSGDGSAADPGACLVIACDKLHNLSDTAAAVDASGEAYLDRFNGGREGTRWYYRTMFEALRPALPDTLIEAMSKRLATLGA